jgi:hypothetical protein
MPAACNFRFNNFFEQQAKCPAFASLLQISRITPGYQGPVDRRVTYCDTPQQAPVNIDPGYDAFMLAPQEDEIVFDDIATASFLGLGVIRRF